MKKNLLFISWDMSILGGINQVTVTLADQFCKENNVFIVSLTKSKNVTAYDIDERIEPVYYLMESSARGREVIKTGKDKLREYMDKKSIDVAFLMGFQVSFPVLLMKGAHKGCKYIFCDHEALMSRWKERKITMVRFVSAILSDKVITLTEQNAKDYRSKFHLPGGKVDYIYNNIDSKILEHCREYDENSRIILSVGRFSPEKNYDTLARIAEKVLRLHSDWKWYIYGDGETFQTIRDQVVSKNLEDRLILKGEVADVSEIYHQAAIFVLTSRREGLPLVLLEAKANHLPCVSFDIVSGPNEIIRDNVDGFLIEPFDDERMVEAIDHLISDKELRLKMAEHSSENLKKFSEEEIIKKWNILINSLTD